MRNALIGELIVAVEIEMGQSRKGFQHIGRDYRIAREIELSQIHERHNVIVEEPPAKGE